MNILQVNKFFYVRGGSTRYMFELSELLKFHDHNISFFSMQDFENKKSCDSEYFVSNANIDKFSIKKIFKVYERMIYSFEVKNKISALLNKQQINITHFHSIAHQLSPSMILELKKRNIPIIQTVHEYHLISPNYNMFHNGKICEITKPNKFYKAIFHKCIKNSYLASLAEVTEKYFHYFMGWERNYVNYFIAPSKFMRKKMIEYGLQEEKIIQLPYFVEYKQYIPNFKSAGYILYFGRLSPEKGIDNLIEAMKLFPKIKLKIVGQGKDEYEKKLKIQAKYLKNIKFIKFKNGSELKKIIQNCSFTVLPSLWYDVAPLSILESFASGKPVVASGIGGIPETVKHGYNGYLFKPGNIEDCAKKIYKLWNDPVLCRRLGKNARVYVEKNFGPEEHYEKLMNIYKMAIKKHE